MILAKSKKCTNQYGFMLKKGIMLNSFFILLLSGTNALAEIRADAHTNSTGVRLNYVRQPDDDRGTSPTLYLAETDHTNTYTALQTFNDLTFSAENSATVNTISTAISGSSTDSELVTAKAVWDVLKDSTGITQSELETTLNNYVTLDNVYSKADADNKYATKDSLTDMLAKSEAENTYATKDSLTDMLTKTEAENTYATKDSLDLYKESNNNAVSVLTERLTQTETDISVLNNSDVMSSGITADKVSAYDGYAVKINAKQDALNDAQLAVLNSGITAADIDNLRTVDTQLNTMNSTFADIRNNIGDVNDFADSQTGNLGEEKATTVTAAIANMDKTIGQIRSLADKVGTVNGGGNLAQKATVEEHLSALAGSVGDRSNYTQQNYIQNNQTIAKSLDSLDIAVGNISRDFTSAQVANEARFNGIEHKINRLENKMEKGLAANNALAALVPLSDKYKTQFSAAMGGYENTQAFAVGAFHYVTEKVLLNTGVAYGGSDSLSYNVGVTFGF